MSTVAPGREDRLAAAYREHHAALVARAAHVLGGTLGAEDCVQEAFVRLAAELDAVREPGAWLRTAVVRRALNEVRRREREAAARRRGAEPDATGPVDLVAPTDARLARALAALPANQRAAAVLCWGDGLRPAEAAAAIGCAPATVRVHLHRARRALATALRPEETDR